MAIITPISRPTPHHPDWNAHEPGASLAEPGRDWYPQRQYGFFEVMLAAARHPIFWRKTALVLAVNLATFALWTLLVRG